MGRTPDNTYDDLGKYRNIAAVVDGSLTTVKMMTDNNSAGYFLLKCKRELAAQLKKKDIVVFAYPNQLTESLAYSTGMVKVVDKEPTLDFDDNRNYGYILSKVDIDYAEKLFEIESLNAEQIQQNRMKSIRENFMQSSGMESVKLLTTDYETPEMDAEDDGLLEDSD